MKSIADNLLEIPSHVPVMLLPNAVLFPNALLPLYIFEPRYRAMLAHCLERQRMFCVGLTRPGIVEPQSLSDIYPVAGLGLVRACVGREDGTSHLVLQGLARVRLMSVVQEQPFRICEVRRLLSIPPDITHTARLTGEILEICSGLEPAANAIDNLQAQLAHIGEPGVLADIVAHTFLRDPHARQEVLEAMCIELRLEVLIRHLRGELGQAM